jgi:hypothetical protein
VACVSHRFCAARPYAEVAAGRVKVIRASCPYGLPVAATRAAVALGDALADGRPQTRPAVRGAVLQAVEGGEHGGAPGHRDAHAVVDHVDADPAVRGGPAGHEAGKAMVIPWVGGRPLPQRR